MAKINRMPINGDKDKYQRLLLERIRSVFFHLTFVYINKN